MPPHPLQPIRPVSDLRSRGRARIVVLAVAVVLLLVGGAWTALEVQQRILRSRAEALLASLKEIQVGASSVADAQSVITGWYEWGVVETNCTPDGCASQIRLKHTLPAFLTGYSDPNTNNLLARMVDHLGLRNAAVAGGLKYKDGVVTEKAFSVEVMLPVRDWFARDGAFVPELGVFSNESAVFSATELEHVVPTHPYRVVRRIKGPYGLRVNFMPQEPAADKAKYMDFRLSCITQFSPCRQEGDLLPAAAELVNEVF